MQALRLRVLHSKRDGQNGVKKQVPADREKVWRWTSTEFLTRSDREETGGSDRHC
jgi:hypothetical protein